MIGAMTEHSAPGTGPQVVCPFVAFDDDRDFRSGGPDHRHRCFAESPAASRALAHQAAYCLSPAFSGCPAFIDWARREAAPPKDEPIRTVREAPSAPREADRFAGAAARPTVPQAPPTTPRRGRRAEWTAPPPWAPNAGVAPAPDRPAPPHGDAAGRDAAVSQEVTSEPDDQAASPGFGAWSGSALAGPAASRGAAGDRPARPLLESAHADPGADFTPSPPAAPAFLAGRASRPSPAEVAPSRPVDLDASPGVPRPDLSRRAAVGYAPGDPARRRVPGPGRERDRALDRASGGILADPAAPSWERPRRFEAYPSLKSGGGGVAALPRPVLYALIVGLIGLALFATPFLLRALTGGGGGPAASLTPIASASPGASAAPSITPVPSPSPTVYTVKAGDVLSRIAVKFGVTVDQIVKANPQIKNPDKLALGDQLVIPPAVAPAITDGTLTPAPSQ